MTHRPLPSPWAWLLACGATGTALCMSVLAGWQRGGWLSERLVWVAIGVVLVAGAHLLPALCRPAPLAVRAVAVVLWLGCMAATSYGHALFFLLSQSHAGNIRMSAIPQIPVVAHRTLGAVMADRASVSTELAEAQVRRCVGACSALRVHRVSLAAQLDALDAEAEDVRRDQSVEDRNAVGRDVARDDPVTARLSEFLGMTAAKLDLFVGLAYAAVLENTACLLWWITLMPLQVKSEVTDRHPAVPIVTNDVPMTTDGELPVVTTPDYEVTRLLHDIEAGKVKPTVAGIRRHLGCAQAKAAALRRQIANSSL